jgi:hypothetical protein
MYDENGTFILNIVTKNIGILLICAILIISSPIANATILLDVDWEKQNATFADYYLKVSTNDYGVEIVDSTQANAPVCSGSKVLKNELIYGKGSAWSQLVLKEPFTQFEIGKEHWFAFAIYLPTDYEPDFAAADLIWELHGRKDGKLGEEARNAPLSIRIQDTRWKITYKKDTRVVNDKNYEEEGNKFIGNYTKGKWTTFVIHTLWDYQPRGYVEIWKDGELVFTKTNGIGFNDVIGPYIKIGLYKSKWGNASWSGPTDVSSRLVYIDDFRVGDANTTYAEIAPNCNNSPTLKPRPPADFQVR